MRLSSHSSKVNPDQPIVTGRTYHATNRPPYELPANKTRTVLRTETHKGEGFNELRFRRPGRTGRDLYPRSERP